MLPAQRQTMSNSAQGSSDVTIIGGGAIGLATAYFLAIHPKPCSITVIERDPVIVRVASEWFGLDRIGKLEIVCADAEAAIIGLARAGRQFDYVMEDVTYADEPEVALPKLLALVPLVTPRGSLVINRHRHGDPKPMARTLRLYFRDVKIRRVRRTGENTLICCSRPLVSRAADA